MTRKFTVFALPATPAREELKAAEKVERKEALQGNQERKGRRDKSSTSSQSSSHVFYFHQKGLFNRGKSSSTVTGALQGPQGSLDPHWVLRKDTSR